MKHKADKSQDNIMGHQNWILESDESMPIDTLYFRHGAWKKEIRTIVYDENFTNGKDWKDIWNLSKELGLYDENGNLKHVEGYTKVIREWQKVNIIFGFAEYHFDWEF